MSIPLAWLAERHFQQLPDLQTAAPATGPQESNLPFLSIIIPARNEADNLPRLLNSLKALSYPGRLEVIVVDDGSCDGTAAVAQSYGVQAVRLDGPPPGWSGKAYACHRGAQVAQGEWLLFTDADTRHAPSGPARAVSYALETSLDGLSLFLHQESNGVADRLALFLAHAAYFVGLNNPKGVLNGQYILLQREVYRASGGFSAVPFEVTEDLALGNHLHRLGYRVPALRGEGTASVHMFQDIPDMWHGLARFGVTSLRWMGPGSILAVLYTILVAAPLELLLAACFRDRPLRWPLLAWLVTALGLLPWAHRFGGTAWAFLAPFGAMQVQLAAIWGILTRLAGRGITWKGRRL